MSNNSSDKIWGVQKLYKYPADTESESRAEYPTNVKITHQNLLIVYVI